ncbi:hypothetical protein QTG56_11255 [Rossellomorea sp. AcN35-11]|nr:hypothetical protein [Rossellomorea aquimaris]WJV31442.1 hypothetical protein QTG56_11255 [Rossellomorea sp. AcN35-11]
MQRRVLYIFIILSFLISGCELSDTLSFKGESEHWSAEVVIHKASGHESEDVILTYKGEEPENVGAFDYAIDAPSWGVSRGGVQLNKGGVFSHRGESLNERNTSEDAELRMTINWDDKSETFTLIRK